MRFPDRPRPGGRDLLSCSLGLRQSKLDAETAAFFRDVRPWSFILFREACVSRDQVRALCADLREAERSRLVKQHGYRIFEPRE